MRRCVVLAAVALAAALLGAAPAQAGLKAIWGPDELHDGRSAYPIYRALGVDVLQRQVQWHEVARRRPADPRNPDDPAYAWPADVDRAYRATRRHGMRLALMVRGTPPWANRRMDYWWAPLDAGDYADFMVAVSRRYPRVRHWMVWGEPSRFNQFMPSYPGSRQGPRAYSLLLDRAYGALKARNRRNIVIGGMTYNPGDVWARDWVRWMELPDGRPPRLDWFGHNPFGLREPNLNKTVYHPAVRDMSDLDVFIRSIRRHWRPRGVRPRLWLSEFCVPSDHNNRAFSFHVSKRTQGRWLARALEISRSNRFIAGLGWWNLQDEAVKGGIHCGLLDRRGKKKPAYTAYKRAR